MRKNIQKVLYAFRNGKPEGDAKGMNGPWTDGKCVYSYGMKIAGHYDGWLWILSQNSTKTTNSHIKACVEFFPSGKRAPKEFFDQYL